MTVVSTSNPIDIPTFEQISTILSQLVQNYGNMAQTFYDMFYNTTPMDISLQLYDGDGKLLNVEVPNRAKDFNYCRNGIGAPEGVETAPIGTLYQDTQSGNLYIKQIGNDSYGWTEVVTDPVVEQGSEIPEGRLSRSRGSLYVCTTNASLWIKSTTSGNTGWQMISADVSSVANVDLSNISELGKAVFANPDLSNLSAMGEAHFASPYLTKSNSNCIVSVPNITNWVSRTETTITFKAGCKFLLPNSRNTDGTISNIVFTLPEDITETVPVWNGSTTRYNIFIERNGLETSLILSLGYGSYVEAPSAPVPLGDYCIWYDTVTNIMKRTTDGGDNWSILYATYLGYYDVVSQVTPPDYDPDTNPIQNEISSIKVYPPFRVLTDTDTVGITRYPFPSDSIIAMTAGAPATIHTFMAAMSGWVVFHMNTGDSSHTLSKLGVAMWTADSTGTRSLIQTSTYNEDKSGLSLFVPVGRGCYVSYEYYHTTEYTPTVGIDFIPAVGEQ